jgi:hypothetical protein
MGCYRHIPTEDNKRADALAQQASSYQIRDGLFFVKERPAWQDKCASSQSMLETQASSELGRKREGSMPSEGQGAGSAELRGERKSGGAKKEFGLQETGKANVQGKDAGPDWREAIIRYLSSPSNERDKRVHQQALKYVVMDDELYRRTVDGMLLRCLGEEQSRLAMGELHEGLCGTHQAAPKMKWALRRVGFFWPIMMSDCVGYQRHCAACQWFGRGPDRLLRFEEHQIDVLYVQAQNLSLLYASCFSKVLPQSTS